VNTFFIVILLQAISNRDSLAKHIYSCVFDWLVQQINISFQQQEHELTNGNHQHSLVNGGGRAVAPVNYTKSGSADEDLSSDRFIGILDIYG
jgi:myosin heavy subunit